MKLLIQLTCRIAAYLMLMMSSATVANDMNDPWAWLYIKKFTAQELVQHAVQDHVIVGKKCQQLFSQLIFSWNALRPEKGHFCFYVQTRDARTRMWGQIHKMIDWGAQIQRSYASKSADGAKYLHVRLETGLKKADAFRIKIEAKEGADLSLVRGIAVNISDVEQFKPEVAQRLNLTSVTVKNVPKKSQMVLDHPRAHELCSPTSSSMLTSYLCDASIDPVEFARCSFDSGLNAYGSWPFNTAHAFERCGGSIYFATTRCNSFAQLHHYLKHNIPVVVSVRGFLEGAPKVYPQGHLLVVIGWDANTKEVICHDPAFHGDENIVVRYPGASFLAAWERSRRLAYIAQPHAIAHQIS